MATEHQTATHSSASPALTESRRVAAEVEQLIGPAAAGDQRAVSDILRAVHPLVRRYCGARLGNTAHLQVTADDVVQEVLLATVKAIPRYRDQGKSFLAFVYGIAANKVADAFRRSQVHPAYPMAEVPDAASPEAGPEEWALALERRAATRELMKVLAPAHREVLVMRIVLGWSAAQTAEAIGTSPGVVRVMQHRALNKLRAQLELAA
ncbi:sigma-70 family RNA polymerase sigma factor [Nocardia farcinica]|uniref:RNA polymerase sigma-E factor n=2 Tax=Nocardia farcinica TaxID=37329 RepID=A0A0H5NDQ3_NOCFR|nr:MULTISPECIES: sigma-70 family RNA polymerase sigma factor [Nocardia]AXK88777.1 sigma-70 family RNA polymerase sigma factor [Nocardia farcinica]MBA4859387.1 sigma-70 family RNA polymerase sigma factor [Nocardia farcinica]MBC9818471.1 sigma-70 family RNA polymerase sigma factor [Nocardia farcinica]MBF6070839.1 sigma-70 family RNA polymerase sigma factor [Nocardia farcinica]MBF6139583.1 sigma-70 family RNA polymerase sigma factor [Nocardia farcinica]